MTYIVHLVLTLFFLILTLDLSFAQGDLSATLNGQQVGTKLTVGTIQVPNNLATKTGSINALIETGNTNILSNPGFEHQSPTTNWTLGGTASYSATTTNEIQGLKALEITASSQTIDVSQTSFFYASQFADGVQGLASIRVKTNHTGTCSVCSVQNSTVSTTNCVTVQANNKWGLYKVPFILGATNNGISLACTSGTGTTYVDDAFVGAVDLQASVDQSRIAGESFFAGTTSCTWTRTNTAIGAFGTTAACPGPTVVTSSMGQWQTTDSDLPRQTINNLPAGTYKATFLFYNSSGASNNSSAFAINDGTTTCEAVLGSSNNSITQGSVISCTFTYNSSGNRTFELYGGSASSSVSIDNQRTAPRASTKFILEYFGSGSVYTSTNADTDWAACNGVSTNSQGWGTSPTYDFQCKREGSDLLMRGRLTAGNTPTAVEARVGLPTWNGVQLTSASSSVIPALQIAGSYARNASGAESYSVLIEPSVSYITFGIQSGATNGLTKTNASTISTTGSLVSLFARIPISGWTNSNIIVGSFNEVPVNPGITKSKSCIIAFGGSGSLSSPSNCTSSPCTEYYDSCGAVSSVTRAGTGTYSIPFANGTFSNTVPVTCHFSISNGANSLYPSISEFVSSSSGGFSPSITTTITGGANSDSRVSMTCFGAYP